MVNIKNLPPQLTTIGVLLVIVLLLKYFGSPTLTEALTSALRAPQSALKNRRIRSAR
jgi:hypothetical protein